MVFPLPRAPGFWQRKLSTGNRRSISLWGSSSRPVPRNGGDESTWAWCLWLEADQCPPGHKAEKAMLRWGGSAGLVLALPQEPLL